MRRVAYRAPVVTTHSILWIGTRLEQHARRVMLRMANQIALPVTSSTSSMRAAGARQCFSHKMAQNTKADPGLEFSL